MECYLDNAATTRPYDSVRQIMQETMDTGFGNPSSMHTKGVEAEEYVETARKMLAKSLKVEAREIIFTSGGTESNNQAIIGTALVKRRQGMHVVTTCFEHASVYNPMEFLTDFGYETSYVPVDSLGHVKEDELLAAIRPDTVLVSVMMVNNEVGAIQDVAKLSRLVKEKNPNILFHVDAIQAYGKMRIYPKRMGIDMLSISAHKIHGPKGIGILFVKDGVRIRPIIHGGEQQKNMRSGTENVPAIAGMGQAVQEMEAGFTDRVEKLYQLKEYFITELTSKLEGVKIHGLQTDLPVNEAIRQTAPHIVSVGFEGIRSEVLLHALEDKGVYVSSGSACSSNHPGISGTLQAIGVDSIYLDSTLRFSFGSFTTQEELTHAVNSLCELVPVLRRYRRH